MTKKSKPGVTANTQECFRTFIDQRCTGYFCKGVDSYLIFEDGRALVYHHDTGAYWVASEQDVENELALVARRLSNETNALKNVLKLAGR